MANRLFRLQVLGNPALKLALVASDASLAVPVAAERTVVKEQQLSHRLGRNAMRVHPYTIFR